MKWAVSYEKPVHQSICWTLLFLSVSNTVTGNKIMELITGKRMVKNIIGFWDRLINGRIHHQNWIDDTSQNSTGTEMETGSSPIRINYFSDLEVAHMHKIIDKSTIQTVLSASTRLLCWFSTKSAVLHIFAVTQEPAGPEHKCARAEQCQILALDQ